MHHQCCCISPPSFGADFLRAHSILLDVKGLCLINQFNFTSIILHSIIAAAPHLDSIASTRDEFDKLLDDLPDITTPSFYNTTPKQGVSLFILNSQCLWTITSHGNSGTTPSQVVQLNNTTFEGDVTSHAIPQHYLSGIC